MRHPPPDCTFWQSNQPHLIFVASKASGVVLIIHFSTPAASAKLVGLKADACNVVAAARQEVFGPHPVPGSTDLISSRPSNKVFETFTDVSRPHSYARS